MLIMTPEKEALSRAVEFCGGQSAFAASINLYLGEGKVSQPYVSQVINKVKKIPAEWAIPTEKVTNGVIKRHQLRPDLYEKGNST